ncbi:Acid phosphatase, class B-like [uncultured Caudovirales phage]|uniref:Acid phosphatase, class B-like n=1 Tax=uncultured Caudovirales phage TaxID=2100421 RepID=A0A6J7WS84_9CAUD|nr:Acid phosphatase, class B-like [uncultured Caudovirales phage]
MKTVVFDIDGTIANNNHRKRWVENKPKDWQKYNETMLDDDVYEDVVQLMILLANTNSRVILCTGREEIYRSLTWSWLEDKRLDHVVSDLYMRPEKDYRSDAIVKVELLNRIKFDYGQPWLWFDDRQQVVDAIRAEGIRVLQVQEGNF